MSEMLLETLFFLTQDEKKEKSGENILQSPLRFGRSKMKDNFYVYYKKKNDVTTYTIR